MIKSLKISLLALFLAASVLSSLLLIFNIIWVDKFSTTSEPGLFGATFLFKVGLVLAVLLIVLLAVIFIYINKSVLIPLSKIKENNIKIKSGTTPNKVENGINTAVGEIAAAYNEMVATVEISSNKLEAQTAELFEKNWELQEANLELEASHGQLQAIIEQLNEMEEKYHALVRNIPELVCVVDNSGDISFINHICMDMLGYEKIELMGTNLMYLIDTRETTASLDDIMTELNKNSSVTIELILKKKDKTTIITEVKFTNYIYNGVNMGLQAIIRDVTQKRQLEEDIIQSYKELSIINTISRSLTSTLDLDELSDLVTSEITTKLGYPSCILALMENEGEGFEIKAFSGKYYKGVKNINEFGNLDLNKDLISKMIKGNEVVKTTEIPGKWILFRVNESKPEEEKIKEILFIPVCVKNKKIGALVIGSVKLFEPHEESLLTSIANNAAVAIDNALLYDYSKKYFIKTINALVAAIEAKDKYTQGHSQRVSKYAVDIARNMGLTKEQVEDIRIAGILHDIGKIGISDTILSKSDKLTREEYNEVKQHPMISSKILLPVGFSDRALKAISLHHERYDGKGYPFGLKDGDILIEAQIIAVADAFDAMTSSRSYRNAMSRKEALKELNCNRSTQFNPDIVDVMTGIIENLENEAV